MNKMYRVAISRSNHHRIERSTFQYLCFNRGAIGHAIGYFILATSSLNAAPGFDPKPF
jgi:hypothetical protein